MATIKRKLIIRANNMSLWYIRLIVKVHFGHLLLFSLTYLTWLSDHEIGNISMYPCHELYGETTVGKYTK